MVFHYGIKAHSSGGGCLDGVDDRSVLMDRGKPLCMYLVSLFLAVTSSSPAGMTCLPQLDAGFNNQEPAGKIRGVNR